MFVDDPSVWTDPCSTCGKPTHHLCANSVHEADNIALRYCPLTCLMSSQPIFPSSQPLDMFSDMPSSLNPPSSLDPSQVPPIGKYVKYKKPSRAKVKSSLTQRMPKADEKPKRKSVLTDLRAAYVGKVLYLTSREITDKSVDDSMVYKFHVTEVNRRKFGGKTMIQCVSMVCETNPLLSIQDAPLEKFKFRLDSAQFDERRLLNLEITAEMADPNLILSLNISTRTSKRLMRCPRRLSMP